MLALTENVTDNVKKLAGEAPEISGLRIVADKILDGGVDEEGNIQFALGQQA